MIVLCVVKGYSISPRHFGRSGRCFLASVCGRTVPTALTLPNVEAHSLRSVSERGVKSSRAHPRGRARSQTPYPTPCSRPSPARPFLAARDPSTYLLTGFDTAPWNPATSPSRLKGSASAALCIPCARLVLQLPPAPLLLQNSYSRCRLTEPRDEGVTLRLVTIRRGDIEEAA